MTSIQWTDHTWNPVIGCSRVSAGCDNCYAMGVAHRGLRPEHGGLTKLRPKSASRPGVDWNGEVRFLPNRLGEPIAKRNGRRVFVNSMSDLFIERLTDLEIAAVFGVMLMADHHAYQVLTKRLERALAWYRMLDETAPRLFGDEARALAEANGGRVTPDPRVLFCVEAAKRWGVKAPDLASATRAYGTWPPSSVQLLASVEDQATADERVPLLLKCPAAVRGVSYEPALGPVDLYRYVGRFCYCPGAGVFGDPCDEWKAGEPCCSGEPPRLDWIIVGGESGPRARPFDVAWARSTITQCHAAGVPVFVKQVGRRPFRKTYVGECTAGTLELVDEHLRLDDATGGDWDEWPAHGLPDLRVREFPKQPQPTRTR